ncbi:hypothetical protein ACRAWD_20695 [Caulobacter segnis]
MSWLKARVRRRARRAGRARHRRPRRVRPGRGCSLVKSLADAAIELGGLLGGQHLAHGQDVLDRLQLQGAHGGVEALDGGLDREAHYS